MTIINFILPRSYQTESTLHIKFTGRCQLVLLTTEATNNWLLTHHKWQLPPTGEGLTWSMGLINFGALLDGEMQMGSFVDHSILLNNYFEKMVQILKSVNGTAYTDKEYRMAALYGLDNAGNRPNDPLLSNFNGIDLFNVYKNKLQKTYNSILTKYSITPSQLNTFYNNNLINAPANKQLPSNCP